MSFAYTEYEERGFNLLGIKFAPLWIPLRRRWETFCFALYYFLGVGMTPFIPQIFYLMSYLFCYYQFRYFLIFYICWYIYDFNTPFTGGRKLTILRRSFTSARDYFPSELVKMADLPPNTNYLFAAFPHGVACVAITTNFLIEVEFEKVFPNLKCRIIAMNGFFYIPILRELILFAGSSGSNKENILYHLNSPKKNKAMVLIVGGASELLLSRPGTNKIVINDRKGFVKLALKAGVPLVPVYSFGENEVLNQTESEWVLRFQHFVRKFTGIPPLFVKGRGFFQYTFGIFPHRRKLTTVVGKPITIPKIENPTQSDVDEYHTKFKEALIDLFETNKEKYDLKGKDAELICV